MGQGERNFFGAFGTAFVANRLICPSEREGFLPYLYYSRKLSKCQQVFEKKLNKFNGFLGLTL
jgi:hypothetical protein